MTHSRNLLNSFHCKKLEDTCYSRPRKSNSGKFLYISIYLAPKIKLFVLSHVIAFVFMNWFACGWACLHNLSKSRPNSLANFIHYLIAKQQPLNDFKFPITCKKLEILKVFCFKLSALIQRLSILFRLYLKK